MKKSSACGNSNSCVFVGLTPDGLVRVADADPAERGRMLEFTREEWDAFVKGVMIGEFRYDRLKEDQS